MLKTLDGSIISIIILLFMLIQVNTLSGNRQNKVFIEMVIINIAIIVIDLFTWFLDGKSGRLNYILFRGFYFLLYTLPFFPSYLFTVYVYDLLKIDIFKRHGLMACIISLFSVDFIFAFFSIYTGWFFSIDADNHYQRGSIFLLHSSLCVVFFVFSFIVICLNRKSFNKRFFYTLLFFFLPQAIGIIIQNFLYGYTTNWIGMMLSLLVIYMNIQSHNLNTDYLTGINNRRYLEEYIAAKIKKTSVKKTFTALMIDIDSFKAINDNFGHDTGDMALKDTANILLKSISRDDFVARTGGDEFIAIIDMDVSPTSENPIESIIQNVSLFNKNSSRPYTLSLSIGQHTYVHNSGVKTNDLLKLIDRAMYDNKKQNNN